MLQYTSMDTALVVHIDSFDGALSGYFQDRLSNFARDSLNVFSSVMLNPFRIVTEKFSGRLALAHLMNVQAATAAGWFPAYVLLMASNSRFIRCGIESHIAQARLSFGKKEVCARAARNNHFKNRPGSKALTTARNLNDGDCWMLCGEVSTIVPFLELLFSLQLRDRISTVEAASHARLLGRVRVRHGETKNMPDSRDKSQLSSARERKMSKYPNPIDAWVTYQSFCLCRDQSSRSLYICY